MLENHLTITKKDIDNYCQSESLELINFEFSKEKVFAVVKTYQPKVNRYDLMIVYKTKEEINSKIIAYNSENSLEVNSITEKDNGMIKIEYFNLTNLIGFDNNATFQINKIKLE